MNVKQFMVTLIVEKIEVTDENQKYSGFQFLEVDLVNGDIQRFLESIPEDLNDHSQVWISISNQEGKTLSYVDGQDDGRIRGSLDSNYQPMSNEDRVELRRNATLVASRRLSANRNEQDASKPGGILSFSELSHHGGIHE